MSENISASSKPRSEQGRPESTRGGYYFTPHVDIYETDEELILYADVPGAGSEEIDLRYEQGELLLHAPIKRQERPAHLIMNEYEEGDFYRLFHIHESIDASRISAECKAGVLTVHLPKAESARPKQVKVQGE